MKFPRKGCIGRGWAPESGEDEISAFAIRELRMILKEIFDTRKRKHNDTSI